MKIFTKAELKQKSSIELRGLLNNLGEPTNGSKNELIQRILDHQRQDTADGAAGRAENSHFLPDILKSDSPVYSDSETESEDEFTGHKVHAQPIMDDKKMSQTQQRVIKLISRPQEARSNPEIDLLLPWLKKKSDVMKNIEDHILKDIVRRCQHLKVEKDEIVIRQGDIGDCFYILLRGTVSVFISEMKGGDEGGDAAAKPTSTPGGTLADKRERWQELAETIVSDLKTKKSRKVNRKEFGKKIVTFGSGKAFGEIALLSEDSVRTASIISDDDCDLMVINRSVYNSTLKAFHEREFQERRDFIEGCVLFETWSKKYKRQLERGLIKESYAMDMPIIKQGQNIRGLIFIRKGNAKVLVEPNKHEQQYPHLKPFQTENDIYEVEDIRPKKRKKEAASSTGQREGASAPEPNPRSAVSRKSAPEMRSHDNNKQSHEGTAMEQVRIKRKQGYAAAEKRMLNRSIVLCVVRDGAVFGDIELVQNLKTFSHTVIANTYTEVFCISIKNVERLITKRNPQTLTLMEDIVLNKICKRATYVQGSHIPLVNHLMFKMTDEKKPLQRQPPQLQYSSKSLPDRFSLFQHILDEYLNNKAQLMESAVPGSVYYKAVMRERAMERARVRQNKLDNKRKEIERELRANMMFKRDGHRYVEEDSEDEGIGDEEFDEPPPPPPPPQPRILPRAIAPPLIPIETNSPRELPAKIEDKPTTAFLTELTEKMEKDASNKVAKNTAQNSARKSVAAAPTASAKDARPDTMRHQSFHTVCMVYDEDEQKSKITHTGIFGEVAQKLQEIEDDMTENEEEKLSERENKSPPPSRCPSDARMIGAPAHMDSSRDESRAASRKSSSKSRPNVETVALPTSGRLRTLPPLNEDKNSQLLSARSSIGSLHNKMSPAASPLSTSRSNEPPVSLPRVTRPPLSGSKSARALRKHKEAEPEVKVDPKTGKIYSDTSSVRALKSETCSVMSVQLHEDVDLPLIENSKKSIRKTKKKALKKA